MAALTQARVKRVFKYDPGTGDLVWRERDLSDFQTLRAQRVWNSRYAGNVAGGIKENGYVEIKLDRSLYKAHRLVWLYVFGCWPAGEIDHINGVGTDNRIANLRDVSRSVNCLNKAAPRRSSDLPAGVNWRADIQKYTARVRVNRKDIHLGSYDRKEDAISARVAALKLHGFHPNHCSRMHWSPETA